MINFMFTLNTLIFSKIPVKICKVNMLYMFVL